ncbi:unnamed protein product [Darwinula stevensoni]|uniref:Uncharacterized protein n=1 Tax=Darwinula stevensoni TaxID=69355 RepID=A0A7R9A5W3_9CRUS|nr:unnamed protein product [Darwinula stevensoni]CAG0895315.1 unnamed protein product [Darwinula stevensoni]
MQAFLPATAAPSCSLSGMAHPSILPCLDEEYTSDLCQWEAWGEKEYGLTQRDGDIWKKRGMCFCNFSCYSEEKDRGVDALKNSQPVNGSWKDQYRVEVKSEEGHLVACLNGVQPSPAQPSPAQPRLLCRSKKIAVTYLTSVFRAGRSRERGRTPRGLSEWSPAQPNLVQSSPVQSSPAQPSPARPGPAQPAGTFLESCAGSTLKNP